VHSRDARTAFEGAAGLAQSGPGGSRSRRVAHCPGPCSVRVMRSCAQGAHPRQPPSSRPRGCTTEVQRRSLRKVLLAWGGPCRSRSGVATVFCVVPQPG
jgi:hypothetical protein